MITGGHALSPTRGLRTEKIVIPNGFIVIGALDLNLASAGAARRNFSKTPGVS